LFNQLLHKSSYYLFDILDYSVLLELDFQDFYDLN